MNRGKYTRQIKLTMEEDNNVKVEKEEAVDQDGEEGMEVSEQPKAVFGNVYERSHLPDLLRVYYRWLFPFDHYFKWLCYGTCGSL